MFCIHLSCENEPVFPMSDQDWPSNKPNSLLVYMVWYNMSGCLCFYSRRDTSWATQQSVYTAQPWWDFSILETLDLTLLVYILTLLVRIYTQVTWALFSDISSPPPPTPSPHPPPPPPTSLPWHRNKESLVLGNGQGSHLKLCILWQLYLMGTLSPWRNTIY